MISIIGLAYKITDNLHFIVAGTNNPTFRGDQQKVLARRGPFIDSPIEPAPPHKIIGWVLCQFCFHMLLNHHSLALFAFKEGCHLP